MYDHIDPGIVLPSIAIHMIVSVSVEGSLTCVNSINVSSQKKLKMRRRVHFVLNRNNFGAVIAIHVHFVTGKSSRPGRQPGFILTDWKRGG